MSSSTIDPFGVDRPDLVTKALPGLGGAISGIKSGLSAGKTLRLASKPGRVAQSAVLQAQKGVRSGGALTRGAAAVAQHPMAIGGAAAGGTALGAGMRRPRQPGY